jgi:hypothetical protein
MNMYALQLNLNRRHWQLCPRSLRSPPAIPPQRLRRRTEHTKSLRRRNTAPILRYVC